MVGGFHGMLTAICEMFKTGCLVGKHSSKGDLANHLKDQSFHLVHWLNMTSPESTSSGRKYSVEYSSFVCWTWGESGKETACRP